MPIAAALVLRNGFDPATVLVGAGALYVAAGLYFRVPVPVQPIKAAAAIALARDLEPHVLSIAGIILGAILLILAVTDMAATVTRLFVTPIVRGLQLGVGLILIETAFDIAGGARAIVAAVVVAIALMASAIRGRVPAALLVVGGGVVLSLIDGVDLEATADVWQPSVLSGVDAGSLSVALVVLVLPQLPLTLGNAVAAVVDLEHRYFGDRAHRVSARSISMSSGLANVAAGAVGGMPMCHGSNGLTAHHRAGAGTYRMNLAIGGTLLFLGLFFGGLALQMLALIPLFVLAGLLGFTGVTHGALVMDQRGFDLALAICMGIVGLATGNLALSLGLGVLLYWGRRPLSGMIPGLRSPAGR